MNKLYHRGFFVILVLVFSAVFFTLLSSLSGFIFVQKKAQLAKENQEKALHFAEAGLEYYKWFLAHNENDITNGTGLPGPYVHTVPDPEGGTVGSFSLDIDADIFCGAVSSIKIVSTGQTVAAPAYKRTVEATYVQPSVAEFSHIVDANVWAGSDRIINGPYHSNQGVRMDGTHNAKVSSGVESWTCTSSFGCSPASTKNGVFGSGGPQQLWEFPTPGVDFSGISVDLAQLKGFAVSSGVYLPPTGGQGYQVTFRNNGTVDVREVTGTALVWGYSTKNGWQRERSVITNTANVVNYAVPTNCPVVFAEDDIWLDGVVSGKAVIAAANISPQSIEPSIILNGNITYANAQGDGLTAIAESDILVGLQVPNIMDIRGVFIAQNGHFGRNHYSTSFLPSLYDPFATRAILNTTGSVVSKGRVGTKWTSGGVYVSGFNQRNDSFDQSLSITPPPFTPVTSQNYKLHLWKEVN